MGSFGTGPSNAADGFQINQPTLCHALSANPRTEILQVVAASCHSLAVTNDGEVFSFGENSCGQLSFPPQGCSQPEGTPSATIKTGTGKPLRNHDAALTPQQKTRRAAEIDMPCLHAEGAASAWEPTRIIGLAKYHVRAVATADTHTLVLAL